MIGIYGDDEETRLAMAYNGLTINNDVYPVAIALFKPAWDAVTEPKAQADGLEAYAPRRISNLIRVEGTVEASSVSQLHDRIDALNAAFDPVRVTDEDDAALFNVGFIPFTFSVPTEDDVNYASGLKPMQYYVRSIALPVDRISKFEGTSVRFSLVLIAADPRRYLQTESALVINDLSETLDNSLASYKSAPTLTLTMSGAGAADFTITRDGDESLTLNLSPLVAGQILEVHFKNRLVTLNGVRDQSLWSSGDFFDIHPGSQSIAVSSLAGIASASLSWRRAFV